MKLKIKPSLMASIVLAMGLAGHVSAQTVNYNWNALGDATTFSQGANWAGGVSPVSPLPPGTNPTFDIFIGTGFPTVTPTPITIGASDVVTCQDQLFGPEWGETLNIRGTVQAGFGFAPVGDMNGPKSTVNLLGNGNYNSSDSIFIGDMFWFAGGPNVTMNLFDNSQLNTKYLALGGHLNLYGGTVTMTNGFLIGPPNAGFWGGVSTDASRRLDLVGGKLVMPTGNGPTILGLISRGIFLSYGKPNDTNDLVITDDGTFTIATNLPLGGSLQSVAIQPLFPTNMVVGTFQQANLLGKYPNVSNVLVSSAEPGVLPSSLPGTAVFTSDNASVLTVSAAGVLSAIAPGTAHLHAVLGTFNSTITVTVKASLPVLTHEYKFSETSGSTTADAIGGAAWAGTLNGDAAFSGTGQLVLSGNAGSAVTLPPGIVSNLDAVTIEAWVTFPSAINAYANLFAFGDTDEIPFDPNSGDGGNYITFSPHTGNTTVQANFGIGMPGFNNEHDAILAATTLDNQANVHIVAVFNPLAGVITIYTNGLMATAYNNQGIFLTQESITPSPLAATLGADPINYIGESLYTGDPGLLANVDEFRIYNGALSSAQVAATQVLGPNQVIGSSTNVSLTVSKSGGILTLKWPTTSALVNVMTSSSLGAGAVWTPANGALSLDGSGNYKLTMAASTSSAQFFRLQQ